METKLFKKMCQLAMLVPAFSFGQDANLTLDGFNTYYNTYNSSNTTVTGIYVEVGADGTNSNNYIASDFLVSLYLLPCDNSGSVTGSTPIIIATYTVLGGNLHQMGTYTFANQSVDLSQVGGIPDGTYRMGAWVNSDASGTGIGDPPDYQSDNAGLMQSSGGTSSSSVINYITPNAIRQYDADNYFSLFPVPASDELFVKLLSDKEEIITMEIFDISGKMVQSVRKDKILSGNRLIQTDVSGLENGIYFLKVWSGQRNVSKKFVINR